MKFYNREKEIKLLANIQEAADENAQMVTLMGRRRIGKTKLLFHATQDTPTLYFFPFMVKFKTSKLYSNC